MRWHSMVLVLLAAAALGAPPAQAQPYCANYDNGSRECGIPTMQSCQQSLSGLGGVCEPDATAQQRPDFFRILPPPPGVAPPPPNPNNPNDPNWMPPPPGQ
jgi:hypothetical protein